MLSIVSTETSVLTFVGIPSIAYVTVVTTGENLSLGNWFFLQIALGYIIGRIMVSFILLPTYFNQKVDSIYEVIGNKFGRNVQKTTSFIFLLTRVLADGIRFLATALIINILTGWDLQLSILLIGFITLIYSAYGGIKTIIKIDAIQFFIYLIGGILTILFILKHNPLIKLGHFIFEKEFFNLNYVSFLTDGNFIVSAIIGGAFFGFASHGVDYMMVQRVLSTKNLKSAQKAMIGSGIFVFIQFFIFMLIGFLIREVIPENLPINQEFASYIVDKEVMMPATLKIFLTIGVLSAAMSTLSSSINSLASSTLTDWFGKKNVSVKQSMIISIFWAVVLMGIASIFNENNTGLVYIGLKIASYTYGALLGLFLLAKISLPFRQSDVIFSCITSIFLIFVLFLYQIAWTWWVIIGASTIVIISVLLYYISKIDNKGSKENIIYFNFSFKTLLIMLLAFLSFNTISFAENLSIETSKNNFIYYGIDNLAKSNFDNLKNKNVALLYNEQSRTYDNKDILNVMLNNNVKIKLLMFPEHGPKGALNAGEKFNNGVYKDIDYISLYSEKRYPSNEDLENIDVIVFDLQDVGSKYYTYISTLTYVMNAACDNNIELIVLDRPNPINGKNIEGPYNENFSFVGMHKIPIRHGMTSGELAHMILGQGWIDCENLDLTVIPVLNWDRIKYFDEYDNIWNSPSPNIKTIDAAIAYNGMCLLEGTNVSEGRGTDKPFLKFGAPWINSDSLLIELDKYLFDGVDLIPIDFIPSSSKFNGQKCYGLELVIKDRNVFHPLKFSVTLLKVIKYLYPENLKINDFLDTLYGSANLDCILENRHCEINNLSKLFDNWIDISTKFTDDRKKYLLY